MKNGKHEKDYYKQLDGWVRMFEQCGYCPVRIEVVTDKIVWCWKWKKITEQQNTIINNRYNVISRQLFIKAFNICINT